MNAIVFITGACVLIIEVVAMRILSPYFGNTIYTVSSVISVVLAALSAGYFFGGKLADRRPSRALFFGLIFAGGLSVSGLYLLVVLLLPVLGYALPIISGPLIASLFLFFLPSFLLGTLSPFAIKLQHISFPEKGAGSIAGEIFFWSTLGSIAGSLGAGFVLIPKFGISNIILSVGAVLTILGFLPLFIMNPKSKIYRVYFKPLLLLIIGSILIAVFFSEVESNSIIYSVDGVYEKITIFDDDFGGRPARFFQQDRSNSGAMFLDSGDLVFDYTKYYALYRVFNPDVKRALVIGGGMYSITKSLLAELPEADVDAVEIEPLLYELAKQYFNVKDDPRFQNYIGDGRRFLYDAVAHYDLIFGDAYYSLFSIPSHLATEEFFKIVRSKLNADGVFIANFIGSLSRSLPALTLSEIKTFKGVFPNSYVFATESPKLAKPQNLILVGVNGDRKIDFNAPVFIENKNEIIKGLRGKLVDLERFNFSMYQKLTDDFAPVEYMTSKLIRDNFENVRTTPNGDEMMAVIEQQLSYGSRSMSSEGRKKTGDFLLAEMKTLASVALKQKFTHKSENGNEFELRNIIGRFWPENPKRIILGTHYDSKIGVPGANDSASGVAVLVEIARFLANTDKALPIGIDFVFFDGEEGEESIKNDYSKWQPLGSTYFAQNLKELYPVSVPEGAIVLDMICDKNLNILKEPASFRNAGKEAEKFWGIGRRIAPKVFSSDMWPEIMDDHTPLNAVGIPSFLVIDFDYPPFHTTYDTLDKCSGDSLEVVSKAVIEYIYK